MAILLCCCLGPFALRSFKNWKCVKLFCLIVLPNDNGFKLSIHFKVHAKPSRWPIVSPNPSIFDQDIKKNLSKNWLSAFIRRTWEDFQFLITIRPSLEPYGILIDKSIICSIHKSLRWCMTASQTATKDFFDILQPWKVKLVVENITKFTIALLINQIISISLFYAWWRDKLPKVSWAENERVRQLVHSWVRELMRTAFLWNRVGALVSASTGIVVSVPILFHKMLSASVDPLNLNSEKFVY